ncbi:MAG: GTPase HflX [Deltaproteobacteria bacterium]|nr:GTPase HflX [Deltaproteobacteria bacterium]
MAERLEGQLQGLKPSQKDALERTFRRRVPSKLVATNELLRHLLSCSSDIHRRVGVLVDRRGRIEAVTVGDAHRVYLPEIGRLRAGGGRLRGLRWIVTQLDHRRLLHQEDLVDLQKLRLDYLMSVAADHSGHLVLHGAHLVPLGGASGDDQGAPYAEEEGDDCEDLSHNDFEAFVNELEAELVGSASPKKVKRERFGTRAVIVSASTKGKEEQDRRAAEMRELCDTAGVEVADTVMQARKQLDSRYVVGKGKLEEIVLHALRLDAELLIFDQELSPAQVRTLGDATELRVIDRTQLILDIFAQHATTVDGKLQVELAQLQYNLPRLSEMSTAMSRLTGGIGGRGPGETKLEINRRRAKDRITQLERAIEGVSRERTLRRKRRAKADMAVVSIVGYTNAGKSTLMNALTKSEVLVENKLFATLDPTSRTLRLPSGREVILTDTVGFIHELPDELIHAFRATLEELGDADLLLHLVDASDPDKHEKRAAVEAILAQMELGGHPTLLVWSKGDLIAADDFLWQRSKRHLLVSATKRAGIPTLLEAIDQALSRGADEPVHAR